MDFMNIYYRTTAGANVYYRTTANHSLFGPFIPHESPRQFQIAIPAILSATGLAPVVVFVAYSLGRRVYQFTLSKPSSI